MHDFLYTLDSDETDRAFADEALREISKANGAGLVLRGYVWMAVKAAGWLHWRKVYSWEKLKTDAYEHWQWADPKMILDIIERKEDVETKFLGEGP